MIARTGMTALAGVFLLASAVGAADAPKIVLPQGNDLYAQLAARAAKMDKALDFRSLRLAYQASAARAAENTGEIARLKEAMVAAINTRDLQSARTLAVMILSRRYVDIDAQAVLSTACSLLKDDDCAAQSRFVGDGLVSSILKSGDGLSCARGWEVISAAEEYVMMAMLDADVKASDFVQGGGHTCQALAIDDGHGGTRTYYFNIDLIRADISARMATEPAVVPPPAPPSTPAPANQNENATVNRLLDDALKARQDAARPALCPSDPAGAPNQPYNPSNPNCN